MGIVMMNIRLAGATLLIGVMIGLGVLETAFSVFVVMAGLLTLNVVWDVFDPPKIVYRET